MGACEITITLKGRATAAQVNEAIRAQRDEDEARNGHQDGYSGDWQTIHGLDAPPDRVFASGREAVAWLSERVEKREAGVAYFHPRTPAGRRSRKIATLIYGLAAE